MKNLLINPFFLCAFLVLFSCQREESLEPGNGYIAFSLNQKTLSNGRFGADSIAAAVVVSIQDDQGKFVYENHKLALFAFGEGYISESLKSEAGEFRLTTFILLNSDDQIIYASPVEGSDIAQYVSNPLPIAFSVSHENTTQVVPEVIGVTTLDTPESFGYANFGFEIVDVPETIPLKVTMKFRVGEILYENIEAPINVKGFDVDNNEKWSAVFPFSGPVDNVLPIKKGFHHYTLSMEKWGIADSQTITAQQLWDSRVDGPLPVTYGLGGAVPVKNIDYYVEYQQTQNNALLPQYKVEYQYNSSGQVERMTSYTFSEKTGSFELSQYSLFTWSGGTLLKIEGYLPDNRLITEDTYQYGGDEALVKITEKSYASGITGEVSLRYDNDGKTKAAYKFSNGGSFEYEFLYTLKNIVSNKTTRGAQLCSEGTYTYDRNINPFKHFGYVDFLLRNYSINNTLTEDHHYIGCSFPTLIPESYSYAYDDQGHPTTKTTYYKGGTHITQTKYFYR